MAKKNQEGLASQLQLDRLAGEVKSFGQALGLKGIEKLTDVASAGGKVKDTVADTVKDAVPGMGGSDNGSNGSNGSKGNKVKVTTIIESVDVPVPRTVAYQQWTQFQDFPSFMKKVENVDQQADEKLKWQAQIFWSHRTWEATITEQVPDERIVWKSQGEKGYVDGAVTFHEIAPDLTRVLAVLEYHPKGLFERTGNIWRAQGRRARVELKHFQRHVATHTLLHQDEVDGWEGEIHDAKVVPQRRRAAKKTTPAKKTAAAKKATPTKRTASKRTAAKKSTPAKKTAARSRRTPAKKSTASSRS